MEDRQLRSCAGRPLHLASRGLRAACLLALLPLSARAEPGDRNQHHRQAALTFTEQDGDRDGVLQSVEAVDLTVERFEAADRDHDGKLTLVEYVDARFEEIAAPAAAPAGATPEAQAEAPPPPGS